MQDTLGSEEYDVGPELLAERLRDAYGPGAAEELRAVQGLVLGRAT